MTEIIGHNSGLGDDFRSLARQIEQSEREKAGVATDIKELYASAKEAGFNTKALRKTVRRMLMSPTKRQEDDELSEIVDQYNHALGILD